MMVQTAVQDLLAIGACLTESLDEAQLATVERAIKALQRPLGRDDIAALLPLLPADGDSCYGLNWHILHAIEAAPDWPLWNVLTDASNAWIERLRTGLANAGQHPPA